MYVELILLLQRLYYRCIYSTESSLQHSYQWTPNLTLKPDPLSLWRNADSLSLFYIYKYGFCIRELAASVPPPLARPWCNWKAAASHNYHLAVGNSRVEAVIPVSFPLPFNVRSIYLRMCFVTTTIFLFLKSIFLTPQKISYTIPSFYYTFSLRSGLHGDISP